jgi:hypothetical protein
LAWWDTGGGPFIVGDSLGRDLGTEPVLRELDGRELEVIDLPAVEVGGRALDVTDAFARRSDANLIAEGFRAEAFVPAHVMARHHVVFDYVGRTFSLDPADEPTGTQVPARSHPRPGWPVVTVTVGGEPLNLLLDTGASCCMLTEPVLERLAPMVASRRRGAFGLANMSAGAWEAGVETVRLPEFAWGDVQASSIVFVSRPEGNFEGLMSSGTPVPVVGAIAGNVLLHMRLEWRAAEQSAWISGPAELDDRVDQVPLVLHAEGNVIRIVGVADEAGAMGFREGDALVAVNDRETGEQTFGEVIEMLRGTVGASRAVTVRRDEDCLDISAEVVTLV